MTSQPTLPPLGPSLEPRPISPVGTRSRLMLEVAAELVTIRGKPWRQAMISLREQGAVAWSARLFASDTPAGIDAVLNGEADFAIVNPAGPLTLAYRGKGPYRQPRPVRIVTVLPSYDQLVFAVRADLGLETLEDVGERRVPLRISVRAQPDHSTHFVLHHVFRAAGFSLPSLETWAANSSTTRAWQRNLRGRQPSSATKSTQSSTKVCATSCRSRNVLIYVSWLCGKRPFANWSRWGTAVGALPDPRFRVYPKTC